MAKAEMQRRYVWRSTRVRDLLDSLYRGYPSGAILLWETDEDVPVRDFALDQHSNPYWSTRLLLDGQQRLTSLSAVIRGQPVGVRGRRKPIEILFNLNHPEDLEVVTEVNEDGEGEDEQERIEDEVDSTDDELQRRFNRMTFVVATKQLEQLPQWVKVWTRISGRCVSAGERTNSSTACGCKWGVSTLSQRSSKAETSVARYSRRCSSHSALPKPTTGTRS